MEMSTSFWSSFSRSLVSLSRSCGVFLLLLLAWLAQGALKPDCQATGSTRITSSTAIQTPKLRANFFFFNWDTNCKNWDHQKIASVDVWSVSTMSLYTMSVFERRLPTAFLAFYRKYQHGIIGTILGPYHSIAIIWILGCQYGPNTGTKY